MFWILIFFFVHLQTTIVSDEMDLYNHVDKSQLTADLGGYLQYSHQAWIRFRKVNHSALDHIKMRSDTTILD